MGKFDLTGDGLIDLMVLKELEGKLGIKIIYLCKCDCGNEIEVRADSLKTNINHVVVYKGSCKKIILPNMDIQIQGFIIYGLA